MREPKQRVRIVGKGEDGLPAAGRTGDLCQTVRGESLMCKEAYDRAYERYRSELEHEDKVINQRLGWFLTAQSLLLGAFGLSLKEDAVLLAWAVLCVGVLSCVFIRVSILAAIEAFFDYLCGLRKIKCAGVSENQYPQLARARDPIAKGFFAAKWLPAAFGFAWLVLALLPYLELKNCSN